MLRNDDSSAVASADKFHRCERVRSRSLPGRSRPSGSLRSVNRERTRPTSTTSELSGSGLAAEKTRRLALLDDMREQGRNPYPYRFDRTHTLAEVRDDVGRAGARASRPTTPSSVAGRIMLKRDSGKLVFATIRDRTGDVQLFISKAVVGDDEFAAVKALDLGDWVGVDGTVMTTRKGELSVKPERVTLLSKAIRPMPDKWHGLSDVDTRFRQRYADLIVNDEARRNFEIRHETVASFRRTLADARVHRGRDAGAAPRGRRRPRPTVHDPPQHARHAPVPADRRRVVPEAADRRRDGAGLRDRPDLPQRGRVDPAQPRVHDDGAVPGVRRLERRHGHHRGADHHGRTRRARHDGRRRSAASRSTSPNRGRASG